jgi:phage shock protein A
MVRFRESQAKAGAMGIFDRMGKVISSNVNSLLDKAEDDKKLVELNLEEMEQQLKAAHEEVIQAVAGEKQLRKKVESLEADRDKWEKRAELALKTEDEALAREALKQKKRVTQEIEIAEKARGEQRDVALRMKDELERMKEKLAELKLRKGSIVSRAEQARAGSSELGARGGLSAFENFKRMEEKIEGKEAEGAAMREVEEALNPGPSDRDLEAKFRDLEREVGKDGTGKSSEIDDEIAAMKKRLRV